MEYILNDYIARDAAARASPVAARIAATSGALDDFRVVAPHKVLALLRQMLAGSVTVTLVTPRGAACTSMLWAVDAALDRVSLASDTANPRVHAVEEAGRATAHAQLDNIKLQFDLACVKLVHGSAGSVFNAPLPRELYRFQRRGDPRVPPRSGTLASARLRHPGVTDSAVRLRVLDLSPRGVALALPPHLPPLPPGTRLDAVQLDLDARTSVQAALAVRHVCALRPQTRGWRLGCEMIGISDAAQPLMRAYLGGAHARLSLPTL